MTKMDWMGECRSVLAHGPSRACFEALCALFSKQEPPDYVVEALEETLRRWPSSVRRRAPGAWLLREDHRLLRLCNAVCLQDAGPEPWTLAALHALLTASEFSGVRALDLSEVASLDAPLASTLATACVLTHLDLSHVTFIGDALIELAPLWTHLRALDLGSNDISAVALVGLLERADPGLWALGLEATALGDVGACVLASASALRGLAHLNIARNGLKDGGARALADDEGRLGGLETLNLWANDIGPSGARALRARFSQVRWLQLADNAPTGPVESFP